LNSARGGGGARQDGVGRQHRRPLRSARDRRRRPAVPLFDDDGDELRRRHDAPLADALHRRQQADERRRRSTADVGRCRQPHRQAVLDADVLLHHQLTASPAAYPTDLYRQNWTSQLMQNMLLKFSKCQYVDLRKRSMVQFITWVCYTCITFLPPPRWLLWSPYVIGQTIIFLPCGFFYLLFFSSPNLSGRRLDVYTILLHMAWP